MSQPLCCTHKNILLNEERARSETTDSTMSRAHYATQESIIALRRDILAHILDMDFHMRDPPVPGQKARQEDLIDLASRDETIITAWYCRAVDITERAKTLPFQEDGGLRTSTNQNSLLKCTIPGGLAKMYRESMLGDLLAEMFPGRTFSPRRSADTIRSPRKKAVRPSSVSISIPLSEMLDKTLSIAPSALLEEHDENEEADTMPEEILSPGVEVHDPSAFGQSALNIPDMSFQVFEMDKHTHGNDITKGRMDTIAIAKNFTSLRNDVGYIHYDQDSGYLLRLVSEALGLAERYYGAREVTCFPPTLLFVYLVLTRRHSLALVLLLLVGRV